jgi:hypothetical protein
MTEHTPQADGQTAEPLGSPDSSRGGPTVEAAVENAEAGSQVEGVHAPFGDDETVAPGKSRGEQLRDIVPGALDGRAS